MRCCARQAGKCAKHEVEIKALQQREDTVVHGWNGGRHLGGWAATEVLKACCEAEGEGQQVCVPRTHILRKETGPKQLSKLYEEQLDLLLWLNGEGECTEAPVSNRVEIGEGTRHCNMTRGQAGHARSRYCAAIGGSRWVMFGANCITVCSVVADVPAIAVHVHTRLVTAVWRRAQLKEQTVDKG
jgi:hypothetical protein